MQGALILVDIQNDFLPSGALPVPGGDAVIPVANRLLAALSGYRRIATQDWHPFDHQSFASQHPGRRPFEVIDLSGTEQVLWPDHCVAHTSGARFATGLDARRIERIFPKGIDREVDSYSGFFDNARRRATGLGAWLRELGVDRVIVLGLATDYCVKATALDALALGFDTTVVADGCRAVEARPGDGEAALAAVAAAGGRVVDSAKVLELDRFAAGGRRARSR
jgi:nicotinamidase/pyrazinamidase